MSKLFHILHKTAKQSDNIPNPHTDEEVSWCCVPAVLCVAILNIVKWALEFERGTPAGTAERVSVIRS